LGQVYKTLVQTVPESKKTEEVEDLVSFFREMIRTIDSSLFDEWESLRHPLEARQAPSTLPIVRRTDPAADPKAFRARLRVELHRLLKALAAKDYEEAMRYIWQPDGDWSPARLEAEMQPYWQEHESIDLSPRARQPANTFVKEIGPRQWEGTQKILDSQGNEDWMVNCIVDLRQESADQLPPVALRPVGTWVFGRD